MSSAGFASIQAHGFLHFELSALPRPNPCARQHSGDRRLVAGFELEDE